MAKKILYLDMDNVLVDFPAALSQLDEKTLLAYPKDKRDEIPGIFSLMPPKEGAVEAFHQLEQKFDTYILSTAPWENPSAWSDKLLWVKQYLGEPARKRLILSHHKNLNRGDFLVDDRKENGAKDFQGEHLFFGKERFPGWPEVLDYLLKRAGEP